ncbi:MAG: hypothetical protein IJ308_04005 [Clostridia bacterium]|nr:hypothetical protein [Clostridia bacterium]
MIDKIKERKDESEASEERPRKKDFVNNVMIAVVVAILIGVAAAYVAKFEGGFDLSLKNVTANGGLLFIACFSVRYLCKHISMNKARQTKEYKEARSEAKKETKKLADEGYSLRIPEYTKSYCDRRYDEAVEAILKNAKIPQGDYLKKYATKSKREILKEYPNERLSRAQWRAVRRANGVKRLHYDEKFLEVEVEGVNGYVSPSEACNVEKEDRKDDIYSLFLSAVFVVFSCSLAGTIIIDLSNRAIILAIVKIITTLFSAALAISKGWNLVMRTEIGRFNRQASESKNCVEWCKKNPSTKKEEESGAA